jgi:hypothetical protein
MRRYLLCFLILAVASGGFFVPSGPPEGDSADSQLLLKADFSGKLVTQKAPEGANALEKASWHVYNQLTGRDYYDPANYMFFRQAVKSIGFIPACFATVDRILRDSKIGTADVHIDSADPYIHEGPEAYAPGK